MRALVTEIRQEVETGKQHVLSVKILDKLEQIEKLSRETRRRVRP